MGKIPSLIPTVVLVGNTNSGKSSLINALTNQDISIVSDMAGTTTDEVVKRYELLGVGPIYLIDTAGLNDQSPLSSLRINKTKKALQRASFVLYLADVNEVFDETAFHKIKTPKALVFNKIDLLDNEALLKLKNKYPKALYISAKQEETITHLRTYLTKKLKKPERTLLSNIKLRHNKIVHVIPIDSEAPQGRLILPQMQLLRECLDLNIISIVLREQELAEYLAQNDDIGLIVTDSQAFKIVSSINKQRFPLTSYSILQANQKGDLAYFVDNVKYLKQLKIKPHFLLMESCSHNASHEDIGRVKIPKMLSHIIEGDFTFDFMMSHDFPDNLKQYDFIIHCGGCMLSADIMHNRIKQAQAQQIPMSNYGLLIAYHNNILDEATAIFK